MSCIWAFLHLISFRLVLCFRFQFLPSRIFHNKKKKYWIIIANLFSFHLVVVWELSSYRFECSSLRLGCSYITIFLGQTEAHQKTILTPSRWSALSAWECREHRTRRSYRISALQYFYLPSELPTGDTKKLSGKRATQCYSARKEKLQGLPKEKPLQ